MVRGAKNLPEHVIDFAQSRAVPSVYCYETSNRKCTYVQDVLTEQPDVVVSPSAFVWDTNLTLTHVTSDLDPCDLRPLGQMSKKLFGDPTLNGFLVMNFFLVIFFPSDRQTDRQKAMPKSQPCIG